MATPAQVFKAIDARAPFRFQEEYDNAGFLIGRAEAEVGRILVSLDITEDVVEEAAELGAGLIVCHHPVIFRPARSVTDEDPAGRRILALIERGIAAICAHTNLDAAAGGVNDILAKALGLEEIGQLAQAGIDEEGRPYGIGRTGRLGAPCTLSEYAGRVKRALGTNGLRCADAGRAVRRVAVGGGACGELLEAAAQKGCDTFVTADVKYNVFLDARAMGVNLIDAGHFATENLVCPVLADWLRADFPGVEVLLSTASAEVPTYF